MEFLTLLKTFFFAALLNSLYINGLFLVTNYYEVDRKPIKEGRMLLWRLRYYTVKLLGDFYSKPVIGCVTCMASLHSVLPFHYIHQVTGVSWFLFPFYALIVAAINQIIYNHIDQ